MDSSTPRRGPLDHRPRRAAPLATVCPRTSATEGDSRSAAGTTPGRFEPAAGGTSGGTTVTREDVEQRALTIATASGRSPASGEACALVAAFLWSFDFLVSQAGQHGAHSAPCSLLRDAVEDLLLRHGEAAFDRALTPLVSGALALDDGNVDWTALFGVHPAELTEALATIGRAADGGPTTDELLHALRHAILGPAWRGQTS